MMAMSDLLRHLSACPIGAATTTTTTIDCSTLAMMLVDESSSEVASLLAIEVEWPQSPSDAPTTLEMVMIHRAYQIA
jgi:hypothetical protein